MEPQNDILDTHTYSITSFGELCQIFLAGNPGRRGKETGGPSISSEWGKGWIEKDPGEKGTHCARTGLSFADFSPFSVSNTGALPEKSHGRRISTSKAP